jgi:hypothetical protein
MSPVVHVPYLPNSHGQVWSRPKQYQSFGASLIVEPTDLGLHLGREATQKELPTLPELLRAKTSKAFKTSSQEGSLLSPDSVRFSQQSDSPHLLSSQSFEDPSETDNPRIWASVTRPLLFVKRYVAPSNLFETIHIFITSVQRSNKNTGRMDWVENDPAVARIPRTARHKWFRSSPRPSSSTSDSEYSAGGCCYP